MAYEREDELKGYTRRFRMGCGKLYVTFNFDSAGVFRELFIRLGKAGGCQGCLVQGLGRLLSLAVQGDPDPAVLGKTLIGMQCPGNALGPPETRLYSCLDGIGKELISIGKKHADGVFYIGGKWLTKTED